MNHGRYDRLVRVDGVPPAEAARIAQLETDHRRYEREIDRCRGAECREHYAALMVPVALELAALYDANDLD